MTKRQAATPTQVRRVLDFLANGGSIRAAAEKFRLSKSTIERIKAGTYRVKPELNKYEERRPGQALKFRRKNTALPEGYQLDAIEDQAAHKAAVRACRQSRNEARQSHPYPEARRLLDECGAFSDDGPLDCREASFLMMTDRLFPAEVSEQEWMDPRDTLSLQDVIAEIVREKVGRALGAPLPGDDIQPWDETEARRRKLAWRGYYLLKDGKHDELAELEDRFDQERFLRRCIAESIIVPSPHHRWIARARRQLARWHAAEAKHGTLIQVGDLKLWINDHIQRSIRLHPQGLTGEAILEALANDARFSQAGLKTASEIAAKTFGILDVDAYRGEDGNWNHAPSSCIDTWHAAGFEPRKVLSLQAERRLQSWLQALERTTVSARRLAAT